MTITRLTLLVLLSVLITASSSSLPCDPLRGCQVCQTTDLTDPSAKCSLCYDGYDLINFTYCQFSLNTCSSRSDHACVYSNCLNEARQYYSGYQCTLCAFPYTQYNYGCAYFCSTLGQYITDANLCKPVCNVTSCDLCSTTDPNQCVTCSNGLYNYQGKQCVASCPSNTFLSGSQCLDCNPRCSSCTSSSDQCSYCQIADIATPPLCACPNGTYYYSSQCVSECPHMYSPKNGLCLRTCPTNQYPSYDLNFNLTCNSVSSSSDDFCIYNTKEIPKLLSISFTKLSESQFQVNTSVKDTPPVCYTFQLTGINSFQFRESQHAYDDTNAISYIINLSDVQNSNQVYCDSSNCFLYFLVLWKNYVSYTFKISLKVQLSGSLINSLSYSSSNYEDANVVCENCVIPKNSIILSSVSLTCSAGQTCSSNSINSTANTPIKITQTISDETLKNNIVLPHSLKLTFYDSTTGYTVDTYLKYTYTNNVLGQITYTFQTVTVQNAQLTVTSTITNAKVTRVLGESSRFLDSTSGSVRYPQLVISITTGDQSKSEDQNGSSSSSTSMIVIGVLVSFICILLGVAGLWWFRVYKKKQAKLTQEKNENQEIQVQGEQEKDNNDEVIKVAQDIQIMMDVSQNNIVKFPEGMDKIEGELKSSSIIQNQNISEVIVQTNGQQQEEFYQEENHKNEEIISGNNELPEKKEENSHGECEGIIVIQDESVDQESHNSQ